jgi:hypothetical protein
MSLNKCKYVDFIQDARVVANTMIVLYYDNTDVMQTQRCPWLEYGLSEFTYSFDLKATYEYFVDKFLLSTKKATRDTIFTDMKLYAYNYRKFADKWFTKFTDSWVSESNDFKHTTDVVIKTIFTENISMLSQLADKMVFVYKLLNTYPINNEGVVDTYAATKYVCSKLDAPNSDVMFPIPISVLRFIAAVDYYRTDFKASYDAYTARYSGLYKSVSSVFT